MPKPKRTAAEPTYAYVGRNIRALRESLGLTQAELGEHLRRPVLRGAIIKYEKGEINLDTLPDVAAALGVTVATLMDQHPLSSNAADFEDTLRASRPSDLLRLIADMLDDYSRSKGGGR